MYGPQIHQLNHLVIQPAVTLGKSPFSLRGHFFALSSGHLTIPRKGHKALPLGEWFHGT